MPLKLPEPGSDLGGNAIRKELALSMGRRHRGLKGEQTGILDALSFVFHKQNKSVFRRQDLRPRTSVEITDGASFTGLSEAPPVRTGTLERAPFGFGFNTHTICHNQVSYYE